MLIFSFILIGKIKSKIHLILKFILLIIEIKQKERVRLDGSIDEKTNYQ